MTDDPNVVLFEGLLFYQARHSNKGYARDAAGNSCEPQLGYAWHYRCVELPRLEQVIHIGMPDKADYDEWRVDGEVCRDAAEAIARLNEAPALSLAEFYAYSRITMPCTYDDAINAVAGAVNPTPYLTDGRWSKALNLISKLIDKSIIDCNEGILQCRPTTKLTDLAHSKPFAGRTSN